MPMEKLTEKLCRAYIKIYKNMKEVKKNGRIVRNFGGNQTGC